MDKSTKKLLSGSVVYFVGNALTQFVSLLLMRFVTGHITPEEYGFFNLVTTVSNLVVPLITLQIADAVFRFVLKSDSEKEKSKYLTTCYAVSLVSVAVIVATVFGLSLFVSMPNTLLVALYVASYALSGIYQKILRCLNRSDVFVSGNLIKTVVFIGLEILLLSTLDMGIEALLLAHILSLSFFIVYAEVRVFPLRYVKPRLLRIATFTEMVRFSIPLIPNAAFWWLTSSVNHVIVSAKLGMDVNGIYSVSGKFSSVLVMVTSVLNMSWQDTAIADYGKEGFDTFLTKTLNTFVKLIFSAIAVLTPLVFLVIPYMIDETYHNAIAYTPFLLMASGTSSISGFLAQIFTGRGDTKKLPLTSLAGMAGNLLAVFLLIDYIGLWGAVVGTLLSDVILVGYRLALTRREFGRGVEYGKFLIVFGMLTVSILLFLFASTLANLIWFFVSAALAVVLNLEFIKNIFMLLFARFFKKQTKEDAK